MREDEKEEEREWKQEQKEIMGMIRSTKRFIFLMLDFICLFLLIIILPGTLQPSSIRPPSLVKH